MEDKLLALISNALNVPIEDLSLNSSSENIAQWDSLAHMSLIFSVEDEFGIVIPDDKLMETSDVRSLLTVIADAK